MFTRDITLAAGQSLNTATTTHMKVSAGVIHEINIVFPPGCAGLVYCAIYHGGHPIFPSTEAQYIRGDNEVVDFKEFYELIGVENHLYIVAWNEDEIYSHKITVRLGVLPKYVLLPQYAVQGIIGSLKSLFMQRR